jgi:transposase
MARRSRLTSNNLAPTLKKGDIVFMDNASVHMVDGVEEAIESRSAIPFYLPAYSPDLNPIEQLFAKLKSRLPHILSSKRPTPSIVCARPSPLL